MSDEQTIADAVLGRGQFAGPAPTQEQQDAVDAFWAQKIAEADAGDGFVRVRLQDIPSAGNALYAMPSSRVGGGRKMTLHGGSQVVTGDPALDADLHVELEVPRLGQS